MVKKHEGITYVLRLTHLRLTYLLYRKYRPQTFGQVVGQEHVVKTLKGALITGRIGHAYLFTGPRGTGKTTLARVFAKALNCPDRESGSFEPCDNCSFCLDVNNNRSLDLIEIDAASNRGIDEIRNLKESALVAAPSGKYKVFVVDECHMLTKDAFNALLKILEEPPSHVVFVLATTEVHKIIPTVLSRVQRFDFKKLMPKEIILKLKDIARVEKIDIDDEGLTAMAIAADGAMRDAEVFLTKIRASHSGTINSNLVYSTLGLIPAKYHIEFLGYLIANDKAKAVNFIQKIYSSGVDLENFTKDFLGYLRKILIHKINPAALASFGETPDLESSQLGLQIENQNLIRLINIFTLARSEIKNSPIPQLPLELAILDALGQN